MKEEIVNRINYIIPQKLAEQTADEILSLILSKIVIKRRDFISCTQHPEDCYDVIENKGYNQCIDQLEEIKNKLKK